MWVGQPPSYQAIVDAQKKEPVGWSLWINDKQLGWALSTVREQDQGPKEIRSYIHFDELPIEQLTSGWSRALFRLIEQPSGKYEMDVQNVLTIDSLGKLLRFDSRIQLQPLRNILRMQGVVDGQQLQVEIRSGNFSYSCDVSLPQNAMLNDALSPLTRLPDLSIGQSWAVPALTRCAPRPALWKCCGPRSRKRSRFIGTLEFTTPGWWFIGAIRAPAMARKRETAVNYGFSMTAP